jgi:hypothetical protein
MGVTASASNVSKHQPMNSHTNVKNGSCPNCDRLEAEGESPLLLASVTDQQNDNTQDKNTNDRECNINTKQTKRWSLRHVVNKNQWVRSVDDVDVDMYKRTNKTCLCETHSKDSHNHRFTKSSSKHTVIVKLANPLIMRRKVIRLLICIIVSFAVCVLPHHIRLLWQYWSPPNSISFTNMLVPPTTFVFFYANSAANPFLFALLSDHFRRAFNDLVPAWCICRKINMSRRSVSRSIHVFFLGQLIGNNYYCNMAQNRNNQGWNN